MVRPGIGLDRSAIANDAAAGSPERSLRVALVSDSFLPQVGGIELHVADLASRLVAAGHPAVVLTRTADPAGSSDPGVRRLRGPRAAGSPVGLPAGGLARLHAELSDGYDILHAHVSIVSPLAFGAILVARRLGLPTVVTFHSVLLASVVALRAADLLSGWSRWPIVVTAVSELVASQLRRAAPGLEIVVLSNGIDPSCWRILRDATKRPGGPVTAVSAIRLHRKKRPLALLRAYHRARNILLAKGRRLTLKIAGDGPARGRLEAYVARHRLESEVELLGAVARERLRLLYAQADMFVLPSIRESFGIAALEARVAGLAVIAMRGAGASAFLHDGTTALIAEDDAALAASMVRLALDEVARTRLAQPDPGLDRYAWSNVLGEHVASYLRAIRLACSLAPGLQRARRSSSR